MTQAPARRLPLANDYCLARWQGLPAVKISGCSPYRPPPKDIQPPFHRQDQIDRGTGSTSWGSASHSGEAEHHLSYPRVTRGVISTQQENVLSWV